MRTLILFLIMIPALAWSKTSTNDSVDEFFARSMKDVPAAITPKSADAADKKLKSNMAGLCLGFSRNQVLQEIVDIQFEIGYHNKVAYEVNALDKKGNKVKLNDSKERLVFAEAEKVETFEMKVLQRSAMMYTIFTSDIAALTCTKNKVSSAKALRKALFKGLEKVVINDDNFESSEAKLTKNAESTCFGKDKNEVLLAIQKMGKNTVDFEMATLDKHGSGANGVGRDGKIDKAKAAKVVSVEFQFYRDMDETDINAYTDINEHICN